MMMMMMAQPLKRDDVVSLKCGEMEPQVHLQMQKVDSQAIDILIILIIKFVYIAVVLMHAFVTSRIYNCCSHLACLSSRIIERFDLVLQSAAKLIGHIPKCAPVSALMMSCTGFLPHNRALMGLVHLPGGA